MSLHVDRVKGFLFDVHGTIIDKGGQEALNKALAEAAAFWREIGFWSVASSYSSAWYKCIAQGREVLDQGREFTFDSWHWRIFAELGIPYDRNLAKRLNERFMRGLVGYTQPLPGAERVLGKLASQYRLGAVSNSLEENTLVDLDRTGMRHFFEVLITSSQVGYRKPHPAIFQAALKAMELSAEEMVFVGDNWEEDILGARQQGMQAIWVKPAAESVQGKQIYLPGVAVVDRLVKILRLTRVSNIQSG